MRSGVTLVIKWLVGLSIVLNAGIDPIWKLRAKL